jgi:hypothetical protein
MTLRDRLAHLHYADVCRRLGPDGPRLLREGGKVDVDLDGQVRIDDERLVLTLPLAQVTISVDRAAPRGFSWRCTACDGLCEHVGTAFALILEEKTALGLAAPPSPRAPVESLSEAELVAEALAQREERSRLEPMRIAAQTPGVLWSDYLVTSRASGKTYRVALRGWERGSSFCSCPDYRVNTLGTCKHILHVADKVRRKFPARACSTPFVPDAFAVHLLYGHALEMRLQVPQPLAPDLRRLAAPVLDRAIEDVHALLQVLRALEAAGQSVTVYPDAEEYIQQWLFRDHIARKVAEIRRVPKDHPLRRELLQVELLPYQLDGIAFAVGAGRAVLADDMGLGKTIQGIGVAELLALEVGIKRVLVVCPVSLKSQWRSEIDRFCRRTSQLVAGSAPERARQYSNDCFFTICNYEQVLRDILWIERAGWDLIILDEGQRIKNWEAKTSRVIKGLRSRFALVLSGTPLENRLDELYSVLEFVDTRHLGPAFRFFNTFRTVDERGRVLGYRRLDVLRERLKPILLRRTRALVAADLPPRSTEIVRVAATAEQLDFHLQQMRVVSSIVRKPFISEMDLLRLQKALLMCRLVANGTFLVDKKLPGFSGKMERLRELIGELGAEQDRKVVLFSEWTSMLDVIEPVLADNQLSFVRLDGSVPQKLRAGLVRHFQEDSECRFFITTNAGSVGLNLQAANTVLNVDLPWNPAVLEQRISRAHRMGQERPVQVYVMVSEETIEENLLGTLSAKHELALAALDAESDVAEVSLAGGVEELKRRLEVLLGQKPPAAVDVDEQKRLQQDAERLAQKDKIAAAGGQLVAAAFTFLGELLPARDPTDQSARFAGMIQDRLSQCMEKDADGRLKLTVTLPDDRAMAALARSLAVLLGAGGAPAG